MPKINICKGKLMKYFYNSNNLKSKILSEGVVLKPMWGDNIMMNVVELEPGSEVPLHSHPNEQAGIVLEGEFEFTIGEEKKTVKKGEPVRIYGNDSVLRIEPFTYSTTPSCIAAGFSYLGISLQDVS